MGLQNIRDASVKALGHPIALRRFGLCEPVLNAHMAQPVKLMPAAGRFSPAGKQPIRERLAIVSERLVDSDRAGFVQGLQKRSRTGSALVALDLHEHPARGPVDGYKQVAAAALILPLRQALHIHMHMARLIGLEAFDRRFGCSRQQSFQVAYAMTVLVAIQTRARDIGTDELPADGQQVIERQQEHLA